ncbi:hypothetical protein B0O99DRAFT_651013 [Bisporella sp. PMI_857]|nr:hypothetical protein B0O99DRAFT_651013 [Bisporella sp. PMI_857]
MALSDKTSDFGGPASFNAFSKHRPWHPSRTWLDIYACNPPALYFDLEGTNLCRHGSISILQLLVLPTNNTHLIGIHTLGEKAILESAIIPKVFFDVRNDPDALCAHFQIKLAGIQDLQLMEIPPPPPQAALVPAETVLFGLAKCIEKDLILSTQEKKLIAPEKGGSYEVFNARPLSDAIRYYCIQDIQFMPKRRESNVRVALLQTSSYNCRGLHKAYGPAGWV